MAEGMRVRLTGADGQVKRDTVQSGDGSRKRLGTGRIRIRQFRDGALIRDETIGNIITQVGEQMYMERGAGIGSLAAPTGMRLGTGDEAPTRTGAGAALETYIAGSAKALDSTATSGLDSGIRTIAYTVTWDPGEATANGIQEVVLTNKAIADEAGAAADTVARALISPVVNKAAGDSLVITWTHYSRDPS